MYPTPTGHYAQAIGVRDLEPFFSVLIYVTQEPAKYLGF